MFSGLTGSNKLEAVEKFGAEQVQIWRRSFATPPPTMEEGHEYYQTIQKVRFIGISANWYWKVDRTYMPCFATDILNIFRTHFTPMFPKFLLASLLS